MSRPKTVCDLCGKEILNCNINKHRNSKLCKDIRTGKIFQRNIEVPDNLQCRFCNKVLKNKRSFINHERTCNENPQKQDSPRGMLGKSGWNKGLTKDSDDRVKRGVETRVKNNKENNRLPTGCAAWSTEQRRKVSKEKGTGGYKENAGRSKKFRVLDSFGKEVCLQSTYELRVSEILNNLNIKWIRPKALKYDEKNYFADFYLPDRDVWLDPKNNYKAKCDEEKIKKVIEQNNVELYIILEHQITEEYFARFV